MVSNILLYIYICMASSLSIPLGHLGCFYVLAMVNSAAMNTEVHVYFQIMIFSGYMPRNGIARSYSSSVFSFQRNFPTVLHSGCYQFMFLPTMKEGSLFSTPSPALFVDFLMMAGLPWWLRWWRICLQCGRLGFNLWVGKIPWRRAWQPTLVFLPQKSHGQRTLEGYTPWGLKETWLSD